jgi:hypothetical protein
MILQGACAPIQCILLYGACLFLTRLHFLIKGGIFDDEPRDYDKIRQSNIVCSGQLAGSSGYLSCLVSSSACSQTIFP